MISCIAIDDDPLFLKSIRIFFEDFKEMQLIGTYDNPVEGVLAVVKAKPDFLLLDIEMPYLDGMEALETLDKAPKVIVISGHEKPEQKGAKMNTFIEKTVLMKSPEILRDTILYLKS